MSVNIEASRKPSKQGLSTNPPCLTSVINVVAFEIDTRLKGNPRGTGPEKPSLEPRAPMGDLLLLIRSFRGTNRVKTGTGLFEFPLLITRTNTLQHLLFQVGQ